MIALGVLRIASLLYKLWLFVDVNPGDWGPEGALFCNDPWVKLPLMHASA